MQDDKFFEDFERESAKMQKAFFRRFWWMIPLGLSISAGTLVFIAYLVKWIIS